MNAKELLYGATVFGLLILLVILAFFVFETAPSNLDTPEQIQQHVQGRRATLYFHDAEIMAKQLFKDPGARWSHFFLDEGSLCLPIGNGVWYATGTIDVPTNGGGVTTYHWVEFFYPKA